MPRPPAPPDREQFPIWELEDLDNMLGRFRGQMPTGYFGVLANSPPLGWRLASLGRACRQRGNYEGTYSHADREFVDQILMPKFGTHAFYRLHTNDALSSGVRLEAIEAIRAGREDEVLTDDEKLLAKYIRQVVDREVDDETWDQMEERLGRRGLVEYTIFIALLQLILTLHMAFGLPEDSPEVVADVLDRFRRGEPIDDHIPLTR